MSERVVTIYTVEGYPVTAAAKRSAGYAIRTFEYAAESDQEARARAVADCLWRDAELNFSFEVSGSRVAVLAAEPTGEEKP